MSNGDTYWESAPSSLGATRPAEIASIVSRALSVLHEHSARAPTAYASQGRALDPTRVPGLSELHKQMEQLRNQAQDLVDELVRVVESMAAGVATANTPATPSPTSAEPSTRALPSLPLLGRVEAIAGQAASSQFRLVNDMRHPVEVLMKATSLVGPKGFELPSHYVGFAPNPLTLGASAIEPVYVTVRVPEQVPPGEYSGLVQGVGLEGASALLTIEVRPAANFKSADEA